MYEHHNGEEKGKIRVIILTKSGKNSGACVSGFDLRSNQFVRFVRDAETGAEIPFGEIRNISILDIAEATIVKRCPVGPQTENILVEENAIHKIGSYNKSIDNIYQNIVYPDKNRFMKIPGNRLNNVTGFHHSLEIIPVTDLILEKYTKRDGIITTRAMFQYEENLYKDYRVTDFTFDLRKTNESFKSFDNAYIIVSIPIKRFITDSGFDLGYFKFVSAIFPIGNPYTNNIFDKNSKSKLKSSNEDLPQVLPSGSVPVENKPWTNDEDLNLLSKFYAGVPPEKIAGILQRPLRDIRNRLKKFRLL